MVNLMEKIYSVLALLTIALGVAVAVMFAVSFAIGGGSGESIAVLAGKVMSWGIRFAAVATLAGLVKIYLSKEHTLTINVEKTEVDENEPLKTAEGTAV